MLNHIIIISQFTLLESRRNRLLLLALLVVVAGFFLVGFVGQLTLTDHHKTQVALLAVYLRLSAVLLVSLFVVSSSIRERQDKLLEIVLALPIHRSSYFLGKLAGFILISGIISLLFGSALVFYAQPQMVVIWCLSLWLELILVAAMSLLMLFSFNQMPAALAAVVVIYSASRLMTTFYLMAKTPIIEHTSVAEKFIDGFIAMLTWLLPDLSQFTRTQWLLDNHAHWHLLLPLSLQTGIYLGLLSMVALFDFYRKNF